MTDAFAATEVKFSQKAEHCKVVAVSWLRTLSDFDRPLSVCSIIERSVYDLNSTVQRNMFVLARAEQRLIAAFDVEMRGFVMRRCVGIESLPQRCLRNFNVHASLNSSKIVQQLRYFSSARPLPDDEHEELAWPYGIDSQDRRARRACPYISTNNGLSPLISSNVLSLTPSEKVNIDVSTFMNDWTVKEHASGEIVGSTSIGASAKADAEHTDELITPSLNSNSGEIEALSNTLDHEVKYVSPSALRYTGESIIPITSNLHIVKPQDDTPRGIWPVFRLMDENGEFRDPSSDGFKSDQFGSNMAYKIDQVSQAHANQNEDLFLLRSNLSNLFPYQVNEINTSRLLHHTEHPYPDTNTTNTLLRAHRHLIRLRTMDTILQNAQRQGRISFYMTCTGEEAIHIGAASALTTQDPIFAQYREQGLLMWRGFTLEQFTNQCFSNDRDLGKGRQMPIHYGSRALNYHTVSSPLGTQLPQAVGAAYRLKLMKKPNVAICLFGDGCASTTDFHAALNFAATLSAPVLFFCRNNGYAISTPVSDQYAGDGIVSRATGYGMAAIRVDGNDIFAVHAAVREAKKYALQHSAPVLIEGMTYRLGHHSTSDDSTRYRSEDEVVEFADRMDPLVRLNSFLQRHQLITEDDISKIKDEERMAVLAAIKLAEKRPKPNIDSMFTDVYKEVPLHLQKQLDALKNHVAKYPERY